jgi:hypothetical protein
MKKGAASGRAGGMDEREAPWSEEYPESHVRQLNAPRYCRGTGGPSRAQDRQLRDRASLFGNQCSGPNKAYLRHLAFSGTY